MEKFQLFTKKFIKAYQTSITSDYRYYYDDFSEYGNRDADTALYFIEGINGTPGQIRFALPSIIKKYGTDIFIKCLYLPEFSSKSFIWEKYTTENLERKKTQLINDLNTLARRHSKLKILVSSNGLYDFMYAYGQLDKNVIDKAVLFWVSVAPDRFISSKCEKIFYRLNGFMHQGDKWFAAPNHNILKLFNPETTMWHNWKYKGIKKKWTKTDLELRFKCFGIFWDFVSVDRFNHLLSYLRNGATFPITIPSYILAATADGYWQGRPSSEIQNLIDQFFVDKQVLYKKASHLWVLSPENLTELVNLEK